jgi:aspartyl-tRNA(Asn)/glutamyl-tRNA(Gln) amidotransferase subunit A
MYLNDIFTVTVNMAGLPGIAVPAGLDAQGPAARAAADRAPFDEETLFQTAHVIEQAAVYGMVSSNLPDAKRRR